MSATEPGRRDDPAGQAAGPREPEAPKSIPVPRRISGEQLARIRREVSVVDLCLDHGIELLPRGEQWVGRCPFHPDPPHDLVVTPSTNYTLPSYPGLIVKGSYWRWPERDLAGNAIDFCMRVLGLSFHDAMRQITQS